MISKLKGKLVIDLNSIYKDGLGISQYNAEFILDEPILEQKDQEDLSEKRKDDFIRYTPNLETVRTFYVVYPCYNKYTYVHATNKFHAANKAKKELPEGWTVITTSPATDDGVYQLLTPLQLKRFITKVHSPYRDLFPSS